MLKGFRWWDGVRERTEEDYWGVRGLFGIYFHTVVYHSRKPEQELKKYCVISLVSALRI